VGIILLEKVIWISMVTLMSQNLGTEPFSSMKQKTWKKSHQKKSY